MQPQRAVKLAWHAFIAQNHTHGWLTPEEELNLSSTSLTMRDAMIPEHILIRATLRRLKSLSSCISANHADLRKSGLKFTNLLSDSERRFLRALRGGAPRAGNSFASGSYDSTLELLREIKESQERWCRCASKTRGRLKIDLVRLKWDSLVKPI